MFCKAAEHRTPDSIRCNSHRDGYGRGTRAPPPRSSGETYYGSVEYTYDAAGNRETMTGNPEPLGTTIAPGTTTYDYDALDRLVSVTFPGPKTVSYQYDDLPGGDAADYPGQRTQITYPDSKTVTYTYLQDGAMETVTDWLSQQTAYTYDDAGRLDLTQLPNGVSADYGYDEANRLTSVVNTAAGPTTISSFTYVLDAVGNRLSMTDANNDTHEYEYDALYRLTEVTYPGPETDTYTYDGNGNRLTKNATTYQYSSGDELESVDGATYWQDNNGNDIIRADTQSFSYDHENRIKSASNIPYSPQYDGDGLRTSLGPGAQWPGQVEFTWDVASALPVIIQDTDVTYVYGLDLISATDSGGEQTYFTYDGLGSVTDLTDGTGAVTATFTYDVFGAVRSQTGASDTYWRFAGEQTDAATGFQYLRARYYDPGTGRFLTRDPLRGTALNPQTHNPYAYGLNNPVNRVDPRGLASESADWQDRLIEELLFQECLKFVLVTAALAILAFGFFGAPLFISTLGIPVALQLLVALELQIAAAAATGAAAGIGYAAYKICTR